ncbi:hypothetical protein KIN20_032049 [Parelaphostrongylus tenuis]|uniref:Uncharacterized protein n=1 Tax=Parelaphostrongylus tenuis TaxID=148309 RepID=A0AAD5WHG0_PARTN|nr:hypothetical protein KIN20_032049 [Parelaphostrongylus tenuis]
MDICKDLEGSVSLACISEPQTDPFKVNIAHYAPMRYPDFNQMATQWLKLVVRVIWWFVVCRSGSMERVPLE